MIRDIASGEIVCVLLYLQSTQEVLQRQHLRSLEQLRSRTGADPEFGRNVDLGCLDGRPPATVLGAFLELELTASDVTAFVVRFLPILSGVVWVTHLWQRTMQARISRA
jgi:hypothetical protein